MKGMPHQPLCVWPPITRRQGQGTAMEEDSEGEEEEDPPSLEFRFECSKLLLELDETTDAAIEVRARSSARMVAGAEHCTCFCWSLVRPRTQREGCSHLCFKLEVFRRAFWASKVKNV